MSVPWHSAEWLGSQLSYHIPLHMRGQPEGDDGKGDQDDEPDDIGDDERHHALENRDKTHVLDHALDDENIHADRRMDEPELHRHDDDDAEPDRVEAEMRDDRENNGHGENDHRHRVHQAAEHQIHEHDQRKDAVTADAKTGQEFGDLLWRLRDGEKIAEQQGADQNGKHRRRGPRRLQQRSQYLFPVEASGHDADNEGAACADAAGFGRSKSRQERQAVEPADDENEQRKRRPYLLYRGQSFRPRSPLAERQKIRPRITDQRDGDEIHADRQQAGENAGDEQLADILLGNDAINRKHDGRRQHGAERAARGNDAGGETFRIAEAAHFR